MVSDMYSSLAMIVLRLALIRATQHSFERSIFHGKYLNNRPWLSECKSNSKSLAVSVRFSSSSKLVNKMLAHFILTLALAAIAVAAPLSTRQSCASGFYNIVARGSNEAPGEGKPGEVADLIEQMVPGSYSVAVDYPATIIDDSGSYPESVTDGINDTEDKIKSYVATCGSGSRIVLVGYSQGGNVMTDVLAGGVLKPDPVAEQYRNNSMCSIDF